MKRTFIIPAIFALTAPGAIAASLPWWEQPTVCKLDPTDCYATMGVGYDSELWDNETGCWGMKMICPEALVSGGDYQPVPMGRRDIERGTNINKDFDTDLLNGDCFGMRKTMENGAMASVNGKYVRVWCNGILDNADEYLENGEITYGAQPTCQELADYGYVATVNNNCYGKYYDMAKYYIECNGSDITPSRIIVLNGADFSNSSTNAPADESAAKSIFDKMESVSESQRKIYFTKD